MGFLKKLRKKSLGKKLLKKAVSKDPIGRKLVSKDPLARRALGMNEREERRPTGGPNGPAGTRFFERIRDRVRHTGARQTGGPGQRDVAGTRTTGGPGQRTTTGVMRQTGGINRPARVNTKPLRINTPAGRRMSSLSGGMNRNSRGTHRR